MLILLGYRLVPPLHIYINKIGPVSELSTLYCFVCSRMSSESLVKLNFQNVVQTTDLLIGLYLFIRTYLHKKYNDLE